MKIYNTILFFSIVALYLVSPTASSQEISFEKSSLTLPESEYYVTRVVDCRYELCDSDLSQRRLNISSCQYYFADQLDQAILSLFQSAIKDTIGKTPVTLKINWFEYEKTNIDLFLGANFDFYTEDNGVFYYEFMAGNSHELPRSNYSNSSTEIIAVSLIEKSYNEYLHRMNNNLGYHKEVQKYALLHNSLLSQTSQNSFNPKSKNGIYYSFNNFRDNLVDTLGKIRRINRRAGNIEITINDKGMEGAWAVAHKNELYLNYKGLCIPMTKSEDGYLINEEIKYKISGSGKRGSLVGVIATGAVGLILFVSSGAILTPVAYAVGGLIGLGIGAAIPQYEISEVNSYIDIFTGRLIPVRELNIPKKAPLNKKKKQLVFYFPQKNYADLNIAIDSASPINFKSSSYYTYQVQNNDTIVNFCLKSTSDEYCKVLDLKLQDEYSFDIYLSKKGKLKCKEINEPKTITKYERWIGKGTLKEM